MRNLAMKRLLIAAALGLASLGAQAVEIGVTAKEIYQRIQRQEENLLFVDVRDPVEIMFVGFTDAVHVNVPYLLVDRNAWDDQRSIYKTEQNPKFIAEIRAELNKRGLDDNAEIVTMCRSGSERGKPSAEFLRANGFPNARYVLNGFQGSAIKEGPQAGFRLLNGWQNSDLPWSPKMNPEKMYRP
jgi:rhodanese-related sulfurtransferase